MPTDELLRELEAQARFLEDRVPVYGRLLWMMQSAARAEFGERLAGLWAGRTFNASYERPLLLLAALRYDALTEGPDHPLFNALSDAASGRDTVTPETLAASLSASRTRFEDTLRYRTVQTNETTRAVAWLWPAHLVSHFVRDRPVALVDLGASAGLNLVADELPALWSDERGDPIPIHPRPPIAERLGLDLSPLDVRRADDALWLRACVWPGDHERLARLDQAIAAFTGASGRPDAPMLEACPLSRAPARLAAFAIDRFVLGVQTIVRDYLPPDDRAQYEQDLRQFLLQRPPRTALVAELEVDHDALATPSRSATLVVRFAATDGRITERLVARTHPHPRQLFPDREAIRVLTDAFA